ncbi:hypothetical protein [Lysobacter gummosus]|uniref:hypothetical protein n=1 Tax=Lysobacter gummosus TaxID=262324 RepID=UPI00362E57DD
MSRRRHDRRDRAHGRGNASAFDAGALAKLRTRSEPRPSRACDRSAPLAGRRCVVRRTTARYRIARAGHARPEKQRPGRRTAGAWMVRSGGQQALTAPACRPVRPSLRNPRS